jgi:hypothetical protein
MIRTFSRKANVPTNPIFQFSPARGGRGVASLFLFQGVQSATNGTNLKGGLLASIGRFRGAEPPQAGDHRGIASSRLFFRQSFGPIFGVPAQAGYGDKRPLQ